ncbi:MAG TPA: hypothetical protein ENI61_04760 [Ignavibacteria bacterium]|nr:hypothetical protein [Ignavibacteria bacterium]
MDDQMSLLQHMLMDSATHRVTVPTDFHGQAKVIKKMLSDDITGMIDSLTDFSVEAASVNYSIEIENKKLAKVFNTWLLDINKGYNGRVPSGIGALATEYFKERWKGASFPVLKIAKWEADPNSNLILPTKMFFLDGGSLYAHDNYPENPGLRIDQYDYSVGNQGKSKLKSNVIFSRCNGRWFDKYPKPYLIKRGVYRNFEIISSLKRNEIDVLDQVIPYLLQVKKNTEKMAIEKKINYDDKKLEAVVHQIEDLIKKTKSNKFNIKEILNTPVRVTQFDEEIKHLIPDLEAIFKHELFEVAEKGILSGMGFIDVVDGASSTRRESILNPRPFIQEVQSGVKDFRQVITDLIFLIKTKNTENKIIHKIECKVTSSPVQGFMSDKFKARIVSLWDKGLLSSKTTSEIVGEISFDTEIARREKEAKEGIDMVMYPHLDKNAEGKGLIDVGKNENIVPEKEANSQEKKNLNKAALDQAKMNIQNPYPTVRSLPDAVKARIKGISKRRKWLKIFDAVFNFYKGKEFTAERAEAIAFATAWEKFDSKNNKMEIEDEK